MSVLYKIIDAVNTKEVYSLDLKQMNEETGYSIKNENDSYENTVSSYSSDTIHRVLVKRTLFGKFVEVLTNEKFDSVYPGDGIECSYEHELKQSSKLVHTFVDAHFIFPANNEEILEYIEEHKDVEAYKQSLIELKKRGKQRAIDAYARDYQVALDRINERKRVRSLLKNSTLSNK